MVKLEVGGSFARQVDLKIRFLRRTGPEADLDLGAFLAAATAQRDHVAFGRKSGLVTFKDLLRGSFVFSAHRLAYVDFYFVLIPGADHYIAMISDRLEVCACRERLFQISLKCVSGAAHVEADARPVSPGCDASDATDDHQEDEEDHSAGSDARTLISLLLGAIVLEHFDQPPQDQQHRPEVGEAVKEIVDVDNAHISQQEEEADKDQHDGAG